jgi:hypothetical protein
MGVLEGKVAVITGSTSGIAARTAEVFVANDANDALLGFLSSAFVRPNTFDLNSSPFSFLLSSGWNTPA